ncbi:uncharacterized protein V6R79_008822 [Siganus canaliculatus]
MDDARSLDNSQSDERTWRLRESFVWFGKSNVLKIRINTSKDITQQLVDAFIEIHSRGVLHRDLHSQNVLMDLGLTVPRVRIIDFGCGFFVESGERLTIYQIGMVLREMLDSSPDFIMTDDCKDFLVVCRGLKPVYSLRELQQHPWLDN